MPAVLCIVNNGNSDSTTGRWRAGEAVLVDTDREWGYLEMPKTPAGVLSVAQVNAADLTNWTPYRVVEMADSGTITEGRNAPIEVEAGDAIVLQFTETKKYWQTYGQRDSATYDDKRNYHWRVSDKTQAEMATYMETHHKEIDMTVVNGPDPQGFRRIEIENLYVTASGDNSWTQEGIDSFIAEWNTRYPDTDLVEYQAHTASTVFVEGTFTTGQAQEFEEVVVAFGLNDTYAFRRWYITSAGMAELAANDGFMNSTASGLGPYFRDGLLD